MTPVVAESLIPLQMKLEEHLYGSIDYPRYLNQWLLMWLELEAEFNEIRRVRDE